MQKLMDWQFDKFEIPDTVLKFWREIGENRKNVSIGKKAIIQ